MTRNFDKFCLRFLSESSRNSWNPERFHRVIPRDLFNEAKILAMVSKFSQDVNEGKMPRGFIGKLNKKWTVALSEDGELYISGFDLKYKGHKADLTMNYNAGKMYRFPLQITVDSMDLWSVSIYDENGELDSDMNQFEEALYPGKIDIPDWSSIIEELKRLGKIGLNDLGDTSGIMPKDDSRGFANSFNNGKIENIINVNNFLSESTENKPSYTIVSVYENEIDPYSIDEDVDESAIMDRVYELSNSSEINVLRDKQIACIAISDNQEVLGVAFTSENPPGSWSFDVIVDPMFRGTGVGNDLLDRVIDPPSDFEDAYGDNLNVYADVVNPIMKQMLEKRGWIVDVQTGTSRWHMTPAK